MIARIWRGAVRTADGDTYAEYVARTGMAEYAACAGNRGAWLLRRDLADGLTEIVTVSLWDGRESIVEFAGEESDRAVFYPEDDRYLVERELTVRHFEVSAEA
jgi:heme-degrading monooxygenase HmoA